MAVRKAGEESPTAPRKVSHITHRDVSGVALFSHLQSREEAVDPNKVHWAMRNLGQRMSCLQVQGGNQRCKEMLMACKSYLQEYSASPTQAINLDLSENLVLFGQYLETCRPLSIGMENALQHVIALIRKLRPDVTAKAACEWLTNGIDTFIRERIDVALRNIAEKASTIVKSGEVILTYGRSSAVEAALLLAKAQQKDIRVIIVDSRPYQEGKQLLSSLLAAGIPCTYVLLSSASYIIRDASRVFIGCSGLLANGSLMNRAGSALVCSMANIHKKPVLVLAETYKFSERVQLDSIVYNDLEPDQRYVVNTHMYPGDTRLSPVFGDSVTSRTEFLSVRYDITPAKFIDMLVTEVGCIPSTSVPVILREFQEGKDDVDVELNLELASTTNTS